MPRKSKLSATIGDNSGDLPDQALYRSALALFVLIEAEKVAMRARHVRLRKRVCESKGIAQEDIGRMFKMKDMALSEIVQYLKRQSQALGAMFGRSFQLDMFAPDPEAMDAIRLKGILSGVSAESAVPPATLTNPERNVWLEGHAQGADARESTIKEMSAEFTDGKDGDFSDPALKTRAKNKATAKNVGLKAAEDFEADQAAAGLPGPTESETGFTEAGAEELAAQKPRAQSAKADADLADAGIG